MQGDKMKVNNANELIGNTPLFELGPSAKNKNVKLFAKLEMCNLTGSTKDRIVKYILEQAELEGQLKPSTTLIEASSGNTGTSLAVIGKIKGYKVIIVTSEKASKEKVNMMRMYGAKVIVCPRTAKPGDPNHYVKKASLLAQEIPDSYLLDQYNNLKNSEAHYKTTGPEIWSQMKDDIDYLVASGSSGGTISGAGKFIKEQNSNAKVVLADPVGSVYYNFLKNKKVDVNDIKSYKVEGAGKDYICKCMDFSVIDKAIQFNDSNAVQMMTKIAEDHGLLVGGSSGGAFYAAEVLSGEIEKGNIVIIFPDAGWKYLSKLDDLKQTTYADPEHKISNGNINGNINHN